MEVKDKIKEQPISEVATLGFQPSQTDEFFRTLFDNSPIGINITQNGKFLYANHEFQRISGYTIYELSSVKPEDLIYTEDRNKVAQNAVKMLKGQRSCPCKYRLIHRSGEFRWIVGTCSSIDYRGKRSVVSNFMNVTDNKKVIDALRESEEFSSNLLKNSADPLIVINADTSIGRINLALERLTGFSYGELVGKKTPYPWWPEESIEEMKRILRFAMRKGMSRVEMLFQKKNGEPFWVDITSYPVRKNGKLEYYLGHWVDISERKRAQFQLAHSAKMCSLGEMAGGIAHELRNPLSIILAAGQLIIGQGTSDEFTTECIQKVCIAAKRASLIINDLLEFARPPDERKGEVDLEAVIEQVLALLCDKLAMSKVIVRKRFKPGLPRVHASPDLLEQVFVNLILNAIKAMPGGGTIKITMGMSRGDIVEMRFADTGIGISREDLPKIFDPFFTTQPVGEGIGLGLAISHSIITKQGGTIEAVSRVGKGTTLIVRLRITRDNSCLATLAERQANYMLPITREIPVNT